MVSAAAVSRSHRVWEVFGRESKGVDAKRIGVGGQAKYRGREV